MKCLFTILAMAPLLVACSKDAPAPQTTQTVESPETVEVAAVIAEKHSGLFPQYMDTDVRPGDDFNAYVNGGWMETAVIPADRVSDGAALMVQEQAEENVKAIIEESARGAFARGTEEQKVGDMYTSYMDMDTRNALGVAPLQTEFDRIAALQDREDLAVYFAFANKIGINVPFSLNQYIDFKDPNSYMMYTWQAGLGLPDREYYFEAGENSQEIRDRYQAHIAKMFGLAGFKNGDAAAATIMELETRLAAGHMLKEKTRDRVALYNKFRLDDLPELMPRFAWDAWLQTAAITDIDGLVITQVDFMKALDGIIVRTSMDDWKTYLTWQVLNSYAHLLNEELDRQNFEFYSSTLQGVEQPLPRWKRAVANVNNILGEVVGKAYVARHFPPEAKEYMLELVDDLLNAYEVSIRELDWMSEETRAQALDKLSRLTAKIGYPDQWKDYSALTIEPDDLVGNIQRSSLFVYETELARQSGPVDRTEWALTPQTVNAYHNASLNEVVFPAAILQPPYFDLTADDAVNYGAIGAVIGHEIGHGFDDKGSTFDGDGVLRNWWTDADRTEFENRTKKLVDQYSAFQPFEDLSVNGEFTLGENIGDLGGLGIALLAYEISLDGKPAPVLDGWTGQQRVFLGYAQSWRKKARDEAVRTQIQTGPHPPAQYRVNGVVRNLPEFYEAFDVSETDALYLPPEERVKIW